MVLAHQWSWSVALAGVPFGLSTASINIGKHIDKSNEDRQKGVHTLPVLLGQKSARWLNITVIALAYGFTLYSVFVTRFLSPVMVLIFFAAPNAWRAITRLSRPRPARPPSGYLIWPRWFSAVTFLHNRKFGNLFVVAVALDMALRLLFPSFWR